MKSTNTIQQNYFNLLFHLARSKVNEYSNSPYPSDDETLYPVILLSF